MKTAASARWTVFVMAASLGFCVLGFYQGSRAQNVSDNTTPPFNNVTLPFANPVEQRNAMILELRELNAQLKEQNALLRSGKMQVVVAKDATQP